MTLYLVSFVCMGDDVITCTCENFTTIVIRAIDRDDALRICAHMAIGDDQKYIRPVREFLDTVLYSDITSEEDLSEEYQNLMFDGPYLFSISVNGFYNHYIDDITIILQRYFDKLSKWIRVEPLRISNDVSIASKINDSLIHN